MSARRLRKAWWVDFSYQGHRTRVRSPDNTKAGAEAYEAVLRRKLARGESIERQTKVELTFGEFVQEWMRNYVATNNKPSEQRAKEIMLSKHLVPFFGKVKLFEIRAGDVERYKAIKKSQGLHPKSINNQLTVLRRCLRSAQEWGHIERIPIMTLLRTPPLETHFLSEEDEACLLGATENRFAKVMFLTALHTGMRMGELLGLDWSAVDFVHARICVRQSIVRGIFGTPKSNRIRYIPMTRTLSDALLSIRKKHGLVFGREDGSPLSDSILKKMIWKACDDAGLTRFGWHRFRHTFASRLISRGVHQRAIQQLLGHASIVMTERYAHLAPTVLTDAVRVLEMPPSSQKWATGGQHEISFVLSDQVSQGNNQQYLPVK